MSVEKCPVAHITLAAQVWIGVVPRVLVILEYVEACRLREGKLTVRFISKQVVHKLRDHFYNIIEMFHVSIHQCYPNIPERKKTKLYNTWG